MAEPNYNVHATSITAYAISWGFLGSRRIFKHPNLRCVCLLGRRDSSDAMRRRPFAAVEPISEVAAERAQLLRSVEANFGIDAIERHNPQL